jgi:hypothetical protein
LKGEISVKNSRREEAIKRGKRKKTIRLVVCALVVVAIGALLAYASFTQNGKRIFSDGHQTITLNNNGRFHAELFHENKEGAYTERIDGNIMIITFSYDGTDAEGYIDGDILHIPDEWDDHHGHGTELRKTSR